MDFLTFFISLRCTNSCSHCLYGCSPNHGEDMLWHVFMKSLEQATKNKIKKINFFGGEPLINPKILPMLQETLEHEFSLILATNCRPLENKELYSEFLDTTQKYKKNIVIVTARDSFHLRFFDPTDIIKQLRKDNYEVVVQDYSNHVVALSKYNINNPGLQNISTNWSCCQANWTDYVGILPDGGWTICPPSLEVFGNIFSHNLEDILKFKHELVFQNEKGCSECLKEFQNYHERFEKKYVSSKLNTD
jgi:MoaA/NifB/PqqE/SkfB family radical SAM enzyme